MNIIKAQLHQKASFVAFYTFNKMIKSYREFLPMPLMIKHPYFRGYLDDRVSKDQIQPETINKTKSIWQEHRKATRTARS